MQHVDRCRISEAEYLALENASDERHEYVNGRVHAMSGASLGHTLIVGNMAFGLRVALEAGQWLLTEYRTGRIELPSLGCSLAVEGIYANLDLAAV